MSTEIHDGLILDHDDDASCARNAESVGAALTDWLRRSGICVSHFEIRDNSCALISHAAKPMITQKQVTQRRSGAAVGRLVAALSEAHRTLTSRAQQRPEQVGMLGMLEDEQVEGGGSEQRPGARLAAELLGPRVPSGMEPSLATWHVDMPSLSLMEAQSSEAERPQELETGKGIRSPLDCQTCNVSSSITTQSRNGECADQRLLAPSC